MCTVILFHDDKFRSAFGRKLNTMRQNGDFCDCVLKCGDAKDFKVHLIVLASASPFLRKKIDAELPGLIQVCKKKDVRKESLGKSHEERLMKENQDSNCFKLCCVFQKKQNPYDMESQCEPIELQNSKMTHLMIFEGLDCTITDNILTYLYTGRMEIERSKLVSVWKQAKYFQLDNLAEFCMQSLAKDFDKNNCLDIWLLADKMEADLENKIVACICENVEHIIKNDEIFKQITAQDLTRLITHSPVICHIEAKYKLVEKWAMLDFPTRLNDFETIIKDFNFQHFNECFMKKVVLTNETFKGSNVFLRKILDGLPAITSTKSLCLNNSYKEKKLIQSGSEIYEMSNDFTKIATVRRIKWRNEYFGQTVIEKNKIFMCGGENKMDPKSKTCATYTYGPNAYDNLSDMSYDRALNSCIYSTRHKRVIVVGGETMPAEIYDPYKDTWIDGPRYTCKSGYYTYLTEMNGNIYAACLNTISRFDFRLNKWDYFQSYDDNTWFRSILATSENSFYAFEDNRVREFDTRFKKFIPNSEFNITTTTKTLNGKHWLRDVAKTDEDIILLFNCGQILSLRLADSKKELTQIGLFPKNLTDCRPYLTSIRNS